MFFSSPLFPYTKKNTHVQKKPKTLGKRYLATGKPSLVTPLNADSREYNEVAEPPMFTWKGGGGKIYFSKRPNMRPVAFSYRVTNSNKFYFHQRAPGVWYWQLKNKFGSSEIRQFTINPPKRRRVVLTSLTSNSILKKQDNVINWQGDSFVSYYRLEMTKGKNWARPQYRFATSGTTLLVNNLKTGNYQLRVGAFSEISGRWEYTTPISVSVQ